jgi:hypothetical protein
VRREIIQCEICKKEHDAQYVLPKEWITTKQTDYPGNDIEQHFCSKTCLAKWTGIELKQEHPYLGMRRFLLVDGETAEISEGTKYSDDYVSIRTHDESNPACWWSSWEKFKQAHDGSGIQWIDQEVVV